MSRRNGTHLINPEKGIKNAGGKVTTAVARVDAPAQKSVRNTHTINEMSKPLGDVKPHPLFPTKIEYSFPVDYNHTESITYDGAKRWTNPKPEPTTEQIDKIKDILKSAPDIVYGPDIPFIAPKNEPNIENVKEALGINESPGPLPDELKTVMEENSINLEQTLEEGKKAMAAVEGDPVEKIKTHTRGRRKKATEQTSEVTPLGSDIQTSPSPAHNVTTFPDE